ncbi:MAG: sigma-70 family RNA polymerase sigma factor [Pseudomonadota bacterium]
MSAPRSDEVLMLSYRDGDQAAFAELYRRHSQGLYLFLAWRSPRREWVNDIMQDSWANLHQARARYEPGASFRTYLFQIARNRLIDLIRLNERVLLASDGGEGDWFDHVTDAAQDCPAPDGQLERKQQTSRLHAMIRLLPVDQREALVLQQFNGMSLEEIAELVAAPVETVKSRLRYAMRKLRQELAPAAEEARA